MKIIITLVLTAVLAATPAVAQARSSWGNDKNTAQVTVDGARWA